jgi:hypothetical protein
MAWMPREHFKSSICSVALPLWLLIHDRNTTIALISAKQDNTQKWLRQIKWIIQNNKFFRWAFDEIRPSDKWDETEIIITRDPDLHGLAQASITASSITSGQASQHYQHIVLDDPVNEKVAASESMLQSALDLYIYLESLLQDWESSTFTLVGTPWGRGDVLEYAMEHDVKNGERLYWGIGARGGYRISPELSELPEIKPLYTEGHPIFPEECPEAKLRHIERQDIEKYYLQYLCKPYDAGRNGFRLKLIRDFIWREDGRCLCECHATHDHDLKNMTVIMTVDPAASQLKEACRSAIVVMALGQCGCRFLLEEWAERVDPKDTIDKIVELARKWRPYIQHMGVEAVGLQLTLKSWLEQLQNEGVFPKEVQIWPLKPQNRNKDARIKSQINPVANGVWHKRPWMHQSDADQNLMWELSKWPYGKSRDLIDAGFGYCDDLWTDPEIMQLANRQVEQYIDYNALVERADLPHLMAEEA